MWLKIINVKYLIRLIQKAKPLSDAQLVDVVVLGTVGKLVRLDILQAHDGLRHDAAVPITAEALVAPVVVTHTWEFVHCVNCVKSQCRKTIV